MRNVFITRPNRFGHAVGSFVTVNAATFSQLVADGACIPAEQLAGHERSNDPNWQRTFLNTVQSWVNSIAMRLSGDQTVGGVKTFSGSAVFNAAINTRDHRIQSASRVFTATAGLASLTVNATRHVFIPSPASAITITLAAPTDGELRRIVFGAPCTVTWVASGGSVHASMPTSFQAGQGVEMIYNQTAGTPANAPATTWYPY